MEEWQFDFEWLQTRHFVKDTMSLEALPDMRAVLLLIGIQELGKGPRDFTKEEKQDLMHIAVCHLLESDGYYEFKGLDDEGWPHYEATTKKQPEGLEDQERLLKKQILQYFNDLNQTNE